MGYPIDALVALGAGLNIDRLSSTSLGSIDRPENVFRPAWRLKLPQPPMNLHEVVHLDAMRHLAAQHCFRIDRRADSERLDDVTGHRLADRGIVKDPVEIRGVPERGKTDRGGVRSIVLCSSRGAASRRLPPR